jgi:hypothetical protein
VAPREWSVNSRRVSFQPTVARESARKWGETATERTRVNYGDCEGWWLEGEHCREVQMSERGWWRGMQVSYWKRLIKSQGGTRLVCASAKDMAYFYFVLAYVPYHPSSTCEVTFCLRFTRDF